VTLPLAQNIVALTSAVLGGFFAITVGVSHKRLCALISFAAGTLLGTTFLHIVPEALEVISFLGVGLALLSGYLVFFLISRFIFHVCPACAATHFDEQTASRFKNIARLLVVALGIHCMMDGIALALGGELEGKVDRSIFLAISVHKFPEGLALAALLVRAGFEKMKALGMTTGIEALTFLGWILGLFSIKGFAPDGWFYLVLVHIGGGFLYLALHALLNESEEHSPRYVILFFLIGFVAIGLTNLIPA